MSSDNTDQAGTLYPNRLAAGSQMINGSGRSVHAQRQTGQSSGTRKSGLRGLMRFSACWVGWVRVEEEEGWTIVKTETSAFQSWAHFNIFFPQNLPRMAPLLHLHTHMDSCTMLYHQARLFINHLQHRVINHSGTVLPALNTSFKITSVLKQSLQPHHFLQGFWLASLSNYIRDIFSCSTAPCLISTLPDPSK